MKQIYTVMEDGCVSRTLFTVTVDTDECVDVPVVAVAGNKHQIDIGDFTLDFGSKEISIKVEDDVIDDFTEEYVVTIGSELYEAIKNDLIDRGVDSDIAHSVASCIEYDDVTVRVSISVRDEEVQIDGVNTY